MSSLPSPHAAEVTRRDFLRRSASGLAAAGLALETADRTEAGLAPSMKSKVVIVTNPAIGAPEVMDQDAVTAAVEKAVCTLFDEEDPVKAFRRVAGPKDIVALKPNCAGGNRNNSTHREVINGLLFGLNKAGVPWGNMIVYEQMERSLKVSGFPILKESGKIRVLETPAYGTKVHKQGQVEQRLSRVLEVCTVLINVPFLKTCRGMGVSLAMKNHQGSISDPSKNHSRGGAPHITDLNMIPDIRKKTKLVLCDATYPLFDGGPDDEPDAHWPLNSVIAATDPVAHDAVGYDLLNAKRKQRNMDPIPDDPAYLKVADMRRLGNAREENIERVELTV